MKDVYLDVTMEVPRREVAAMSGDARRGLFELCRDKADAVAHEAGGRIRTDAAPEFVVAEGHSSLLGDVFLIASRWPAVAPENVEVERGSHTRPV